MSGSAASLSPLTTAAVKTAAVPATKTAEKTIRAGRIVGQLSRTYAVAANRCGPLQFTRNEEYQK